MRKTKIKTLPLSNWSKKERFSLILGVFLFLALAIFIVFWRNNAFFALYPLIACFVYVFGLYYKHEKAKAKEEEEKQSQFVTLFTYFSIYIEDGYNVYNALEAIVPFSSGKVKLALEGLLAQIDEDKSLEPYLSFASNFQSLEIKEVMMAVYQMVDQGGSEVYLHQFRRLFSKLSDGKHQREEKTYLEKLDTLSSLPLVGSGITMIMLMLAILEIMEGMLDGL